MSPGLARHVPRQSRARWVLLCCLTLSAAACSSSSPGAQTPPSQPVTSPASSSSAPSPSVQSLLLAAYDGTYTDVEAAVRKHDSNSPLLGRHAVPPAKFQLQTDVEQYLKLGVVPVGIPALHAKVASLDLTTSPNQAILTACPGAPRLVDLKTGKPVKERALPPNPFTVTLQTTQGHWAVSYFKINRSKTCSG